MTYGWIYKHHKLKKRQPDFPLLELPDKKSFDLIAPVTRSVKSSENSFEILNQALNQLLQSLKQHNPCYSLCAIQYYFLTLDFDEWANKNSFKHSELEIAQALALTFPWEEQFLDMNVKLFPELPSSMDGFQSRAIDLQIIVDEIKLVADAYVAHNEHLLQLSNEFDADKNFESALKYHARTQTLYVRNWSSPTRMRSMVRKLFEPFNDIFLAFCGVSSDALIDILRVIFDRLVEKLNKHMNVKRRILKATNKDKCFQIYKHSFSDPEIATLERLVSQSASLQDIRTMLYMESDIFMSEVFRFTIPEVGEWCNHSVSAEVLKSLMNALSLIPGRIEIADRLFLLMDNPVWTRPFIRVKDSYLVPCLHLLDSFLLPTLESLLIQSGIDAKKRYEKRRATFLEEEAASELRKYFPMSLIYSNLEWADEKEGETDLFLQHQNFFLIVEAKAGQVSGSAKRGGDSLRQTINRVVGVATEQAIRFETLIQNKSGLLALGKNGSVSIDLPQSKIIVRVALLLEPFLSGLGEFNSKSIDEASVTMSLADLELVLSLLRSPSERMYYLYSRKLFQNTVTYAGDETDLFGFYLTQGFPWRLFQGKYMNLYGACRFIKDPISVLSGGKVSERQMQPWWLDCIRHAEQQNLPVELLLHMWDLPLCFQYQIEEARIITAKEIHKPGSSDLEFPPGA